MIPLLTLRRLLCLSLCAFAAHTFAAPTLAQTLARPGWQGSGIATNLWWKHAVFYHVDPANFSPAPGESPLHALTQRLDYLRALGVDALLLTPLQPDPAHPTAILPALGTLDDLDALLREASRRDLRVLLDLAPRIAAPRIPVARIPATEASDAARFWLNRGIAGFHLSGSDDTAHAQAAQLRKVIDSYLGHRILIGDADPTLPIQPRQRTYKSPGTQTFDLVLDTSLSEAGKHPNKIPDNLTASALRPVLDATQDLADAGRSLPLLATDGPGAKRSFSRYGDGQHNLAIAKVLATILLASRAEPLLYYGQELGVRDLGVQELGVHELGVYDRNVQGKDVQQSGIPTPTFPPLIAWDAPLAAVSGKPAPAPAPPPTPAARNPAPEPRNAALEQSDPNSLFHWYRQLTALRHGNTTIAAGSSTTIDQDDKNVLVWVRQPQSKSSLNPPLVILCNLTAHPVTLSLKADLARLHLRGSFLRTVLRSDSGMGTLHLDAITIAPYTAYIGQLRF